MSERILPLDTRSILFEYYIIAQSQVKNMAKFHINKMIMFSLKGNEMIKDISVRLHLLREKERERDLPDEC